MRAAVDRIAAEVVRRTVCEVSARHADANALAAQSVPEVLAAPAAPVMCARSGSVAAARRVVEGASATSRPVAMEVCSRGRVEERGLGLHGVDEPPQLAHA